MVEMALVPCRLVVKLCVAVAEPVCCSAIQLALSKLLNKHRRGENNRKFQNKQMLFAEKVKFSPVTCIS